MFKFYQPHKLKVTVVPLLMFLLSLNLNVSMFANAGIKEKTNALSLNNPEPPLQVETQLETEQITEGSPAPSNFSLHIPILMYHYVRINPNPNDLLGESLSVSPQAFEVQMHEVVKNGYTSITFEDLINYIQYSKPLPKHPIILSFDDGHEDAYTNAFPTLQKYHLKGSFGVITGFVGQKEVLSWSQIKTMKAAGEEFISHTVNHYDLRRISPHTLTSELSDSKKILDKELNQDTKVIIYPSGKYDDDVAHEALKDGYIIGRTTQYGKTITRAGLMSLPAVRMTTNVKMEDVF